MRYFIELAYLGTNFHGWQIQPNAHSVQQELEESLSKILGEEIKVVGAGRTDTGVHASYYVAHFDSEKSQKIDNPNFIYHLNAIVSRDIAIHQILKVEESASARFSAIEREYKYYISLKKDPFVRGRACMIFHPLDIEAMTIAANRLLEYSDFTSFAKLHTDTLNNICDVRYVDFRCEGDMLIFTIRANRFLRNMVRAIVGTLLDVGRGKISVERFCEIIEAEDRGAASSSADSSGLYLTNIVYPQDIFIR